MTSFEYPLMASLDGFPGDAYPDFMTSQPYTTEATTLPSIDSFDTMIPYAAIPSAGDYFTMARPAHSPSVSPGDTTGLPKLSSASESGASAQSTTSSTMASPHLRPRLSVDPWAAVMESSAAGAHQGAAFFPVASEPDRVPSYVDPQELNPLHSPATFAYPDPLIAPLPYFSQAAPVPSQQSAPGKVKSTSRRPSHVQVFTPYPFPAGRRQSSSSVSQNSSQRSIEDDETNREACPIADCGRSFKDLRAHMLTHQNERPEKCPIQTCEYHVKGFARKYDKNRHTLTHYKGTMVCGFCPGSGSGGEKTFNRADVFKRHLTSVHGVEQVAPNSRRKSPTLRGRGTATTLPVVGSGPMGLGARGPAGAAAPPTGRCSTCSAVFASAQDLYEHLDDCVLRVVQQIDPGEAINEMHLAAMSTDSAARATLERHNLPVDGGAPAAADAAIKDVDAAAAGDAEADDYEDEDDEEAYEDEELDLDAKPTSKNPRAGKGAIDMKPGASSSSSSAASAPARGGGGPSNWHSSHRVRKADRAGRPGLTFSKGGVRSHNSASAAAGAAATGGPGAQPGAAAAGSTSVATMSARKRRRHLYPAAWGSTARSEGAGMKKRVLCVYDGPRRLCKDDMMLDSEFEVRVPLASSSASAPPELGGEDDGEDDGDDAGDISRARSPVPPPAAGTAYVTDLDVQSLRRADAIYAATNDERGPWIPDNILELDHLKDDLLA